MITQTMNRYEVLKQITRDTSIRTFLDWKVKEWKKILKKYPPKYYFGKAWEWHSKQTNQDFVICLCKQSINDVAVAVNAKVKGDKRDYYYMVNVNAPEHIEVTSTHFWKRYAERMGFLYNMPQLIAKFHARNPYMNVIYFNEEENRVVYAVHDGIALCDLDHARGFYMVRTFVSKAMLKQTQREAYDVLDALTKELDAYYSEAVRKDSVPVYQKAIQGAIKPFAMQATDIYAKFWESED